MVHYNPDPLNAAQHPPPRCPKCGSHKTEIAGNSADLKITYLRCSVCGAHSKLPSHDAAA